MLEHADDGGLGVQCEVMCDAPQQRHVSNKLKCIPKSVAAADEHAFFVEQFSAPRGFLVCSRASRTTAIQQGAITNAPGCFEIAAAHLLPPNICQLFAHPPKGNARHARGGRYYQRILTPSRVGLRRCYAA